MKRSKFTEKGVILKLVTLGILYMFVTTLISQQDISSLIDSCLTDACFIFRYHRMASVHFVLYENLDSTEHFLNLAMSMDSSRTCKLLKQNHKKHNKQGVPDWMYKNYFASNFSPDWWSTTTKLCDKYIEVKNEKITSPAQKSLFADYFERIENRDQYDRKALLSTDEIRKEQQKDRDLLNRQSLDSFYSSHGSINIEELTNEDYHIIWLVLQHSEDCEWNRKWIYILLDAFKIEAYSGAYLDQTFRRFYHPIDGFCTERDSIESLKFIEDLKMNYPMEHGKKFGYNSF